VQGYSSTDRRTSLLNDWDLQEIGSSEVSEVVSCFDSFITSYVAIIPQDLLVMVAEVRVGIVC
jgi:hypothetical protein